MALDIGEVSESKELSEDVGEERPSSRSSDLLRVDVGDWRSGGLFEEGPVSVSAYNSSPPATKWNSMWMFNLI